MVASEESFTETASIVTDGGVSFHKYTSSKTRLTVCIAETDGPVISGFMLVPTETHDDDGLPHTLEHLVYMGSEKYPYKGVLDSIANVCLAGGTNAWTDTDNTCYLLSTAGSKGFLNLLPVYVEHLFYPLLTDSSFHTEIHHVNGEGENAGVVYMEVYALENTVEDLGTFRLLDGMYPGICGYKSNYGGKVKNLRESTTNEKIRQYHRKYYRPENLTIIITGQIDASAVFESLRSVEDRILKDLPKEPYERPWQSPVPPLHESVTTSLEYPSDEEEFGNIFLGFRGPKVEDYNEVLAIEVLLKYMTSTSASLLKEEFIESTNSVCSDIENYVIENLECCIYFLFQNVPVDKIDSVKDRFFQLLQTVVDGKKLFDMKVMKSVIENKKLNILKSLESKPHNYLANCVIGDVLYGKKLEDLKGRLQQIPTLESFLEKKADFWLQLIKHYFVEGKFICVLCRPSSILAKKLAEDETKRVFNQKEELGPEGLKNKEEVLAKAIEANNVLAPDEMIKSFLVPINQSLNFHSIKRYSNREHVGDMDLDFDIHSLPCRFQVDDVKTNFVHLYALMDTRELSATCRMYLPLLIELIGESSILRDGAILPYTDVLKELTRDTVSRSVGLGFRYRRFFCSEYPQMLVLSLTVVEEKYAKAIQWIHELLYKMIFDAARIKSVANKMLSSIASLKCKGDDVLELLMSDLLYNAESNRNRSSMMRQHNFLTQVLSKLEHQPCEVIEKLKATMHTVTQPANVTIHMGSNIRTLSKKVDNLEKPWMDVFPVELTASPPPPKPTISTAHLHQCYHYLSDFSPSMPRGKILGLSAVDSSFLTISAPCFNSFNHDDYPALLMITQYLVQLEGPLWKQIRGQGLSYGYSLTNKPNEGLIYFELYRSTHLLKAYQESEKVLKTLLSNETQWDETLRQSALGSLAFSLINREKTVSDVVTQSLKGYYRDVDENFTQTLLSKISAVTFSDMERVGKKYLMQLFDSSASKCSICCHSDKVTELVESFKGIARELTIVPSLEHASLTEYTLCEQ